MSVNNSLKYTSVTKASECPQYQNIVFILCTIYNLFTIYTIYKETIVVDSFYAYTFYVLSSSVSHNCITGTWCQECVNILRKKSETILLQY